MEHAWYAWAGFIALILVLLALDLFGFNKKAHEVKLKEAAFMSVFWISISLVFAAWVWREYGAKSGLEFLTGYLVEKALSVDNLFVFIALFGFFQVPKAIQHRVLFWGIVGALVMRGVFIGAGAALMNIWHAPLLYVLISVAGVAAVYFLDQPSKLLARVGVYGVATTLAIYGANKLFGTLDPASLLGRETNGVLTFFAVLLLASAYKLYQAGEDEGVEPEKNPVVVWIRQHYPVHNQFDGDKFWGYYPDPNPVAQGRVIWMFTPLFVVLVAIELTDLMFATDSIPAIFAVSKDPFILYSSNIFAILGLRALYFLLAGIMPMFAYLKQGLVIVLGGIGVKMLIDPFFHVPITWSLGFIGVVLAGSVVVSLLYPPAKEEEPAKEDPQQPPQP